MQNGAEEGDEDEDEETLQLKLQEIQARLRLKKLQRDKTKAQTTTDPTASHGTARAPSPSKSQSLQSQSQPAGGQGRAPPSQPTVIPASPVRKVKPPETQTSPARVLLGIDKGRKAKDVSLKRAPSLRKRFDGHPSPSGSKYLSSSKNSNGTVQSSEASRPRNFNERLTAARSEEEERRERQERIKKARTDAFGISKDEMEKLKTSAVVIPEQNLPPPEFSREDILQGRSTPASGGTLAQKSGPKGGELAEKWAPTDDAESDSSSFEAYSSFHLSKRIMPHGTLARQLRHKRLYGVKDMLRLVKSPDYQLPDVEEDIVVFAIVASKSEPRSHKPPENGTSAPDRGKYMVMTIVDLEWELELFLFSSGFTRFWKIPEGTVVAILNPNVMPPPRARAHSGKFSLVINSDADTIIEVGTARDLGFCKSMKKDGNLCSSWVNKKRTEFCEFHSNEMLRKTRAARTEVNQVGFGGEYRRKAPAKKQGGGGKSGNYDRETGAHWFASKALSASAMIDGVVDRREKEEAMKRRVLEREKEQKLMKALSRMGSGTGQEYMRSAGTKPSAGSVPPSSGSSQPASQAQQQQPGARDLSIIRGKANASLAPVKRKRPDSSQSLASTGSGGSGGGNGNGGLGWGGGLSGKLSRMRDGEKLAPEGRARSPVKKKTRFVTAGGIREAGRESLGGELGGEVGLDDEEDELVILR